MWHSLKVQTHKDNDLNQTINNHIMILKSFETLFSSAFQREYSLSAVNKEISLTTSHQHQFKTLLNTESEFNFKEMII